MKKKNLVFAITMTLVIGLGATAYAASNNSSTAQGSSNSLRGTCMAQGRRAGLGKLVGFNMRTALKDLLKSKGVTDDQITSARESGKTLVDLLKEKGVTDQQIKDYLLTSGDKAIDAAVAANKITSDQGTAMKEKLKERINAWTPGQGNKGEYRKGMMMFRHGNRSQN